MAKNMLPIVALGAAALFLLKKKDEPKADGKKANGDGTNGNGASKPADKPAEEPKEEPKDEPAAEPEPAPEPDPSAPEEMPPNLSLEPVGDFQWGARIRLGDNISEAQTDAAVEVAAKHAAEYSALPFVVTLFPGHTGIQIHMMVDGQPKTAWVPDVPNLDSVLGQMLDEHIPSP